MADNSAFTLPSLFPSQFICIILVVHFVCSLLFF